MGRVVERKGRKVGGWRIDFGRKWRPRYLTSFRGVPFEALDENLMLQMIPGVFCAGEMLDWEAPTGGYLLTACFATGHAAGQGVLTWLANRQ